MPLCESLKIRRNPDRFETRHRSKIVAFVVSIHVALCMWGAYVHSPTIDEPAYLASGISHWKFGRFDLCKVSPPLVRLVAAVPVILTQPEYDWDRYRIGSGLRAEHPVGRDFLIANGDRSFRLFTLGRWACIPFSVVGAVVSFRWANDLFGRTSAYAALLLWCFSPNVLAHAQLLTPESGVTALSFAASYSFWRWSRKPTWSGAAGWGGILGLAVLAKTNAIVLYAALPIAFAVGCLWSGHTVNVDRRSMLQIVLGISTSVYAINLGYAFDGTCRPLGEYEFVSSTFTKPDGTNRFRGTAWHSVPVPVPVAFLEGIDLQRRDFENSNGRIKTYFRQNWYDHGWWWYYLYVVGVKVPEAIWVLGIVGTTTILFSRGYLRAIGIPVISGVILFALPCTQTGFGGSLRYVLPAFPFAFLVASASVAGSCRKRLFSAVMIGWLLWSALACFPHSLSYFNALAGGPRNGHVHLLDGNVDWGQDLLFIRHWLQENPEKKPVYLGDFGFLPAHELGIIADRYDAVVPGKAMPAGTYLISVNCLRGDPLANRPELRRFLNRPEDAALTPAVRIFEVRD